MNKRTIVLVVAVCSIVLLGGCVSDGGGGSSNVEPSDGGAGDGSLVTSNTNVEGLPSGASADFATDPESCMAGETITAEDPETGSGITMTVEGTTTTDGTEACEVSMEYNLPYSNVSAGVAYLNDDESFEQWTFYGEGDTGLNMNMSSQDFGILGSGEEDGGLFAGEDGEGGIFGGEDGEGGIFGGGDDSGSDDGGIFGGDDDSGSDDDGGLFG